MHIRAQSARAGRGSLDREGRVIGNPATHRSPGSDQGPVTVLTMRTHKGLEVWREEVDLAIHTCDATRACPSDSQYPHVGLRSSPLPPQAKRSPSEAASWPRTSLCPSGSTQTRRNVPLVRLVPYLSTPVPFLVRRHASRFFVVPALSAVRRPVARPLAPDGSPGRPARPPGRSEPGGSARTPPPCRRTVQAGGRCPP